MNINQVCRDYDITIKDITCIALDKYINNRTQAWSEIIGKDSKTKHPNVMATNYFNRPNIVKFIFDMEEKSKVQNGIDEIKNSQMFNSHKISKTTSDNNSNIKSDSSDAITPDNIKQKLEDLVNRVSDPKDKLAGLIKIADFVGLNNTGIDLTTPTIYLPQRCSDCNMKR